MSGIEGNLNQLVLQEGYHVVFMPCLGGGYHVSVQQKDGEVVSVGTGDLLHAMIQAYGGVPEPLSQTELDR